MPHAEGFGLLQRLTFPKTGGDGGDDDGFPDGLTVTVCHVWEVCSIRWRMFTTVVCLGLLALSIVLL
jgi:hypothetical protein